MNGTFSNLKAEEESISHQNDVLEVSLHDYSLNYPLIMSRGQIFDIDNFYYISSIDNQ